MICKEYDHHHSGILGQPFPGSDNVMQISFAKFSGGGGRGGRGGGGRGGFGGGRGGGGRG